MLTHRQVILKLKKSLKQIDPNKQLVNWEMATFRHNYFKVIDEYKSIKACTWNVDVEKELVTLRLVFPEKMISCTYDHKTKQVTLFDEGQFIETIPVESLFDSFKKISPKKKIIVKIKKVV